MASWALLLLASVLLGSSGPGAVVSSESSAEDLAFSSLTPECYDLETANPCDGEQLHQGLALEDPQGKLLTTREEQGITCWLCKKIIKRLRRIVGEQPNEDTVAQAVSRVCDKLKLLKGVCRRTMNKFLGRIAQDVTAGKTPHDVCVDILICKS